MTTLSQLVQTAEHFQRATNIYLDFNDASKLNNYIPSQKALSILEDVLNGTINNQRAHVIYGPYGVGKSILGVILINILTKNANNCKELKRLEERIKKDFPASNYPKIIEYLNNNTSYLPVILHGNTDDLQKEMLYSLKLSLSKNGLEDIKIPSAYEKVKEVIELWKEQYENVYFDFINLLQDKGNMTIEEFYKKIDSFDEDSFNWFIKVYPELAAGAEFEYFNNGSVVKTFKEVNKEIKQKGYDGIIIIHDEFGRFLENNLIKPSGEDMALLQDIAEECCNSSETEMHQVLLTHKTFGQYAYGLEEELEKEWRRIEGRFNLHHFTSDNDIFIRLLDEAIERPDEKLWSDFVEDNKEFFNSLYNRSRTLEVFRNYSADIIENKVVKGCFPLHPLTVYCLPKLSAKISQNERTLFTFLSSDDANSLKSFVKNKSIENNKIPLVPIYQLYDYFEESIKADKGVGGSYKLWLKTENALGKVETENDLARKILKTIAVVNILNDPKLTASTSLLTTALSDGNLHDENKQITSQLQELRKKKLIFFRSVENKWEIIEGSDIDFEKEINEIIESKNIEEITLTEILQEYYPPPSVIPKKYNEDKGMIRFFEGVYLPVKELLESEQLINRKLEKEFKDGMVIYVLPKNSFELEKAKDYIEKNNNNRVVFALPNHPLDIFETLKELYALKFMKSDTSFLEEDPKAELELNLLMEDTVDRIKSVIGPVIDPDLGNVKWFNAGIDLEARSNSELSREVSDVCENIFDQTPKLLHENLNKNNPSNMQLKALEKVIDGLLEKPAEPKLGLKGYGPDVAIYRMMLEEPGIVVDKDEKEVAEKNEDMVKPFEEIVDGSLRAILSGFREELVKSRGEVTNFKDILVTFRKEPYGLRRGVLPIFLALSLREFMPFVNIKYKEDDIWPIKGVDIVHMCFASEKYSIKVEAITKEKSNFLEALNYTLEGYIYSEDYGYPPSIQETGYALVRWFQSLPKFTRETKQLSDKGKKLRKIVRKVGTSPSEVLFEEFLPFVKESQKNEDSDKTLGKNEFVDLINRLIEELNGIYYELLLRIENEIYKTFSSSKTSSNNRNVLETVVNWWQGIETENPDVEEYLFPDVYQQSLVEAIKKYNKKEIENSTEVIMELAKKITGLNPVDWNDNTEKEFYEMLSRAKEGIEKEVSLEKEDSNELAEISIYLPDSGERKLTFKKTELSSNANMLLENIKNTIEFGGNSLSAAEKRSLVIEIVNNLL
ncbi:hypothetical protein [Natranaerofaba carboxydovora]|uniref:hypothetical protein n=1 Tax=Natranaerofaba carboxydovora TaxID=2742683 RepID=UPI001F148725|nr:hypothetical protein [Natranaerofaba carboxydovora]UMZ74364.1 hypothetical protein ACONDI_01952 [Natranaerofaba carboxydovora]